MRRIIFGGAFDPIHNGHLNMAQYAAEELSAEVIFLPAKKSIWKEKSIAREHKIKMIELAIEEHPNFRLDTYELDNELEHNYTIDTIKHFKKIYPNDELYFLIGTDQVNQFDKWKSAKELSELVQIVFFNRPQYQLDESKIKEFRMKELKGELKDISSNEIRNFKKVDMPIKVRDYIIENKLYFAEKISQYIKDKRYFHSFSVAKLAYEIAINNHLDNPDNYFIAGMLHDIGKQSDTPLIMKMIAPEYLDLPRFTYHQFVGAYIAEKEFDIHDKEILDAIRYHASGKDHMSLLGKVVYAADKIEPTRDFDSSDLIKAMMDNAEEGFVVVLRANQEFLLEKGKDINNVLTSKCFEYYL